MRISFVGKGGSGKSTIAGLFTQCLRSRDEKVIALDADINQHFADLIDVKLDQDLALSRPENVRKIKEHLTKNNSNVESISHVYKTTPPGQGSNLVTFSDEDFVLSEYGVRPDENTFFLHVGTYEKEGIGTSCYHTDLAIFENILSHLNLDDEWLAVDMVAGTDAFSNTLHAQFDAVFLVVEPTPEGLEVYNQYRKLSEEAGITENLHLIGNKVMDEEDKAYLEENINQEFIGFLQFNREIKKLRQRGKIVRKDMMPEGLFEDMVSSAENSQITSKERLERIHKLHRKYVDQDYVKNAVGDITDQIDKAFSYD